MGIKNCGMKQCFVGMHAPDRYTERTGENHSHLLNFPLKNPEEQRKVEEDNKSPSLMLANSKHQGRRKQTHNRKSK